MIQAPPDGAYGTPPHEGPAGPLLPSIRRLGRSSPKGVPPLISFLQGR
jgi:hypothetical protein